MKIEVNGKPANLTHRDLNAPGLLSALTLSPANINSPGPVEVPSARDVPVTNVASRVVDVFLEMLKNLV